MIDEYRAKFVRGPDEPWTVTIPGEEALAIHPGPGRLSRLGFITFSVAPAAAGFLMLPVDDETRVDVTPSPSEVSWPSSDGALLVQTVPHNVHFSEPKFTAVELYRLHHARRMHPHDAVLVASHDPTIMVGHNFSKIG